MKKIIAIILVLAVMLSIFVFSYRYRNQKLLDQGVNLTDEYVEHSAPDGSNNASLLIEDKENDYQLYFDGEAVTVVHGEYQTEVLTWAAAVNTQTPQIYCKDYDNDGETELLVKVVSGVSDTLQEYSYTLSLFDPVITADAGKDFSIITATSDTWKTIFENSIRCELTQLKSCKKFLQFVMDDAKENIDYNSDTGITSNKHVSYALALADNKQQYYTLDRWNRGLGIYNIEDDGSITLDIQVLVNYENAEAVQYVGDIHCDMALYGDKFNIVPDSIVFAAKDEYTATDPRDVAGRDWKCVIHNGSVNTNFKSTDIDWIEAQFSLPANADSDTQYFENLLSKIKCVDSVEFTQKSVILTAKKGYTFTSRIAEKGTYAVIIHSGKPNEYNIAYSCTVQNDNDTSMLIIDFDKTYDKEDFDKILIKFGV